VLQSQKDQRKAVQMLQIGDEVVTTGGLIGEVKDVVTLSMALPSSLSSLRPVCVSERSRRRYPGG
jgi:hypothetical protein